jgi:D-glycero-alpha-D-manno-heptose-7-phosphate kinase
MIVTQTPLRISFAGGFTDFKDFWSQEGGAVLSTAIDKYIYVIIKQRFDDLIVLNYSQREIVSKVDAIQHGLIREAMRLTGIERGVEIITLADIPTEGCGLGSSSSVTVGLLNAFHTFRGQSVTAAQLAEEACQIEIEILKKPTGIQDQYIAAYGDFRTFRFNPDGTVAIERLELPEPQKRGLEANLHLFFLGKTRQAEPILADLQANLPHRLPTLRKMRDEVWEMRDLLLKGDLDNFGRALHQAWLEKRSLSPGIANGKIDYLYQQALEAGALGGKVTGAGGGGFFLLYCPPSRIQQVRERLPNLMPLPFHLEPEGSKVILNQHRI